MTTGQLLRDAIEQRYPGLSQAKVAAKLKVPPGNLSEWLNDKHEPSLGSLRGLARKLKRSVASLIGDGAAS